MANSDDRPQDLHIRKPDTKGPLGLEKVHYTAEMYKREPQPEPESKNNERKECVCMHCAQ